MESSKESEYNKYNQFVAVLKKKKDLDQKVLNALIDITSRNADVRYVKMALDVLKEKFMSTHSERTETLVDKIFKLQDVMEETNEKIWDDFLSLVEEYEKLGLTEHPRYLLAMVFLGELSHNKLLTEEEK